MRVAIYGRYIKEPHLAFAGRLLKKLASSGVTQVLVYKDIAPVFAQYKEIIPFQLFHEHKDLPGKVDYLFSLGGDGTLLDTLTLVKNSSIPILGINMGRLGFLSSIPIEEMEEAVDALAGKTYAVEERSLLSLQGADDLFPDAPFALNEITIRNASTSAMLTVHVYLNGEFLNSYWADGLIISTPTGSTAYSLSCGGPIILPDSSNFIINPIAPHNLNVRPLVIPDTATLTLKPECRQGKLLLSLDARSAEINNFSVLTLSKENFNIKLIRLQKHSFLSTLRNKLKWGSDSRN